MTPIGELPHGSPGVEVRAVTGFPHLAGVEVRGRPASGWLAGGWVSARWSGDLQPGGGAFVDAARTRGRWALGARSSAEWLGGALGPGRVPAVDLRLTGIAEVGLGDDVAVHAGEGVMWLAAGSGMPDLVCLVDRVGVAGAVSERTAVGLDLEVPWLRVAGPKVHPEPAAVGSVRYRW